MNLLSLLGSLATDEDSVPALDRARCIHADGVDHACERCVGVCPVDAISVDMPPAIDPDACVGCSACVPACPVGAIAEPDPVMRLLGCAARVDADQIELLCTRHEDVPVAPTGAAGIQIRGCLAALGVGAYIALAALGVRHVTALVDDCAACDLGGLRTEIDVQVERASRLGVTATLSSERVTQRTGTQPLPVWQADRPPVDRRNLLRVNGGTDRQSLARFLAGRDAPVEAISRDRWRIVAGLHRLVASGLVQPDASLEGLGFASVGVGATCNGCGMCASACPTGALTRTIDGEWRLEHSLADCIACEACVTVCPVEAVHLTGSPRVRDALSAQPAVVWSGVPKRCARCGAPLGHDDAGDRCPPCEFRRQNPFGHRPPTGPSAS